jgi:hypothetical protein
MGNLDKQIERIKLPLPKISQIPYEFDLRAEKVGFTMRGWNFTRREIFDAVKHHRMLNPAIDDSSTSYRQ